jgi:ribonuclease HI
MSDKKKHFYAVVKGRRPGIYLQWGGAGGAEEQIKGYPGAVFRGFATRAEAEYFVRSGGFIPAPPQIMQIDQDHSTPAGTARPVDYHPDLAAGKVVIFTDGASTGNPGPGGYGVVLLLGEERREMSGGFRCTTNNRMELLGVISALSTLKQHIRAVIYSDSRYVVDSVEKGWARRWRARGWMRDATNPAENADLWARLLDLLDQHPVEFRWVRGHADHPENERCDRLAVQAAHQKNLLADTGYKGTCT